MDQVPGLQEFPGCTASSFMPAGRVDLLFRRQWFVRRQAVFSKKRELFCLLRRHRFPSCSLISRARHLIRLRSFSEALLTDRQHLAVPAFLRARLGRFDPAHRFRRIAPFRDRGFDGRVSDRHRRARRQIVFENRISFVSLPRVWRPPRAKLPRSRRCSSPELQHLQ